MHKKAYKRSTFNPLVQKIKAPDHLARIQDENDSDDETSNQFQLPSLQKKKCWKDTDGAVSSWDRNSTTTTVSWSPEMEGIATWKVVQQWEAVERTLFDDGEQVSQTSVLEECIQWRTQIPHLRIVGKNPFLSDVDRLEDCNISMNQAKSNVDLQNEDLFSEHSLSTKERSGSSNQKFKKLSQLDDVIDIIIEYVITELFPNKEIKIDSLSKDLSKILKIRPAPIYSNKSSAKSTKVNWLEEAVSHKISYSNNHNCAIGDGHPCETMKNKYEHTIYNSKAKSSKEERNATSPMEKKLCRPQTGRNKLGTVFSEKIVVSPVPYVLTTRESFSTLRTTPIKFMGQSLAVSPYRGSNRNISSFKNSAKKSSPMRISNYQSAWHAPVSPAVWPKNVKLAPIDTSRLPSSKNRSLAPSPSVLLRSRKPLSPISRSTLPASAQTLRNNKNEVLEIQGKHVAPGQSPKLSLFSAGWDYSPRIANNRKKKTRTKMET